MKQDNLMLSVLSYWSSMRKEKHHAQILLVYISWLSEVDEDINRCIIKFGTIAEGLKRRVDSIVCSQGISKSSHEVLKVRTIL